MAGRRTALIVANGEYAHEGLRHLKAPSADAHALAEVWGDQDIGGFEVQVIHNEAAHRIQEHVENLFRQAKSEDVVLLHFSCHGLKSDAGELYFAASNTRPDLLASTAVSANFVRTCIRDSMSRSIVLFLDCCFGGAFGKGFAPRAGDNVNIKDSFPRDDLGGGRGRAVIAASNSMQFAFEGDTLADDHSRKPSVFSAALIEGLATGNADIDADGRVSLNELYAYVFDRVREANPNQTPTRDIEMQGEFYLARSGKQRIQPLPIPRELQAAVDDPNPLIRLGAVTELRTLLAAANLPTAKGAFDALTKLAETDIGDVAEAATEALQDARLQVAESVLHFGTLAQHTSSPHRTVHIGGLPLARACTVEPSHRWIVVQPRLHGFDVSVETSHIGGFEGHIAIRGPTDAVSVPVAVKVTGGSDPRPGGQFATWLSRVMAGLIDLIPVLIVPLVMLIGRAVDPALEEDLSGFGGLVIIGWTIYNRWVRQGKTGQSLGKRIMGITLIDERTGQPVGVGNAFLRDLAHLADYLPLLVGYFAPLWDDKNRTFGDQIMHTVVVTTRSRTANA